ncbi:hypothetical protein [Citricoccus sp. CH26A]|uniref:hypothetical protein n=1 Tax=Citricoccus sp. CH26A TaxID=1045009 RepID=UPI000255DE58|nr:hypothetical protein [Citricoccus sp. CH26A]
MRLTHVASLRLPFGPLLSYDLAVSPAEDTLPVSFDQARHVGGGDRTGSWMALAFSLPAPVPRDHLAAAWRAVVTAHGTLRTVFVRGDDGAPTLHEAGIGPGTWVRHEVAPGQAMQDALRAVLDAGCTPFARPSHRFCVIETADGPAIVVGADHAHVDMWSLLVIARDLLAALDRLREGLDPGLAGVPAFAEHSRCLLERPGAPPRSTAAGRRSSRPGAGPCPGSRCPWAIRPRSRNAWRSGTCWT